MGYSQRQGQTQRGNYLERERKQEKKIWLNQRSQVEEFTPSSCFFWCFPPVISDVRLAEIQMFRVFSTGSHWWVGDLRLFTLITSELSRLDEKKRQSSIPQQLQVHLYKKKNNQFSFRCHEQAGKNTNVQGELINMQVSNTALTNTRVTMVFNNATNCGRLSAASLDSCANATLSTRKSTNAQLIAGQLELVSICEINCRFLPACQPHYPANPCAKACASDAAPCKTTKGRNYRHIDFCENR